MEQQPGIPEDVMEAARLIKALQDKTLLTRADKDRINQAKLKVAYWACGSESIPSSRENLSFVLGKDAQEIMTNYDKALAQEQGGKPESEKDRKDKKEKPGFWQNA